MGTAELKSHYTQGVQDAVYQYKTDREPFYKPKNAPEPLLALPGGALVHFAVSNASAEMTTRLDGLDIINRPELHTSGLCQVFRLFDACGRAAFNPAAAPGRRGQPSKARGNERGRPLLEQSGVGCGRTAGLVVGKWRF